MTDHPVGPCEACPLVPARAVASRGAVPARVLLLAGAPRYHEERDGLAFASPAFEWLEERLADAGIDPHAVHYATLTGCRPPYQRPVRTAEIAACGSRLDRAIDAVAPEVIVLCGPEAVTAMLPGVALGTAHGQVVARGRRRYVPMRHPYAALHCARYVAEIDEDLRRLGALLAASQLPPLPSTGGRPEPQAPEQAMALPGSAGGGVCTPSPAVTEGEGVHGAPAALPTPCAEPSAAPVAVAAIASEPPTETAPSDAAGSIGEATAHASAALAAASDDQEQQPGVMLAEEPPREAPPETDRNDAATGPDDAGASPEQLALF